MFVAVLCCIFWGVVQLGYVVPGSVCEEHIDDLSQFVTNASRIQLLHDAALIDKAVKDGTQPSWSWPCPAKRRFWQTTNPQGKLIVSHLGAEGVPICLGATATDLGDRNCSGEEEMCGKPMETHLERHAKGEESQPSVQDGLGCATAHGDGQSPCSNLRSHFTKGGSTAQVNAMCKNLKMCTVMGKTQACANTTVAWFSVKIQVPQTAARAEQVSKWITMCRGFNVDTRRRFRKVWTKRLPLWQETTRRWNQACLEAEHTRSLANARRQCHSGRRFVLQGADHRQFLQWCDWRKVSSPTLPRRPGLSWPERKFWWLHVRWTFLFVEPWTNLASLRMARFPTNFSVCVATREPWPPGSTNGECPSNSLINQTHMRESDQLVALAQEIWDADQVLFVRDLLPRDWLLANEFAECTEARMWESSWMICQTSVLL